MCTITDATHVHLEVPPHLRRGVARALLEGAAAAGVDPTDPCHLTTTDMGFRASRTVFDVSGLELEGAADQLAAQALDDEVSAPPPVEVPAATAPAEAVEAPAPVDVPDPAPPAPRTRKRKN